MLKNYWIHTLYLALWKT